MLAIILITALATLGICETIYLIRKRIRMERPVCMIGDDCSIVLESKYNKLFLIRNDVLGLLAYIAILLLCIAYLLNVGAAALIVLGISILVGIGSAASLMFTFIQWRFIKAWCFWCLMSAFTLWTMGIILIIRGF